MALADALIGAGQSIQQLLLQRELEKAGVSPIQLAQAKLAQQNQEMGLRQQDLELRRQEYAQNQARLAANEQDKNDQASVERIPGGRILSLTEPAAGSAARMGLADVNTTLPSTQMTGTDLGRLTTRSMPSDNVPQSVTKLPTEKQQNATLAAEDRRQGLEDRRAATEQASADRRAIADQASADRAAALAARPPAQGRMTFDEWKQRQDYAAGLKKDTPPKLNQRDNDTVVTIHQMMPRINEVIGELQKSTANQPPPRPGLLGAVSQLGQKAERVGQGAAYKMGLAQPSDVSNRIQLESLMQVLGSVPYLRGTRNYQFIQQIQQHLADPTATDAANLERLKQLQRILPEMEQAIYDVENKGVIPHEHGTNYTGAAPTAGGFSVRELP